MAIVTSRVVGVFLSSSEIQRLPSDLQELRFQTLFPALWMASAMRLTDFGNPAGGVGRCPLHWAVRWGNVCRLSLAHACSEGRRSPSVFVLRTAEAYILIVKALQRNEWFSQYS